MMLYVPSSRIILNSLGASIATPASWKMWTQNETKTVLENCLNHLDSLLEDKERILRRDSCFRPLEGSQAEAFADHGRLGVRRMAYPIKKDYQFGSPLIVKLFVGVVFTLFIFLSNAYPRDACHPKKQTQHRSSKGKEVQQECRFNNVQRHEKWHDTAKQHEKNRAGN